MPKSGLSGSVRGAPSNGRPYRDTPLDSRAARFSEDHRMRGDEIGGEQIQPCSSPPEANHIRLRFVSQNRQPTAVGRQVFRGIRQSMPSSR